MVAVLFNRMTGPYRTGEAADFPQDVADKLCASGAAQPYRPEAPPTVASIGGIPGDRFDRAMPPASASAVPMTPPGAEDSHSAAMSSGSSRRTGPRAPLSERMGGAAS